MKRFIIRVALEAVAIVAATITATQLVKAGHPALGLSVISVYGVFNLYRLSIEKIDGQRAQNDLLKGRLSLKEEQVRRLEAALVDAAAETLWVSSIETRGDKIAYVIDVPGRGRFVICLPTYDAPVASNKG